MTQAGVPDSAPNSQTPRLGPNAILLADRREGPDLWGVSQAMQPLAELCLSAEAETPFALGLVGARGSGKSFALRRLLEAVEARAAAARAPALSKVVLAQVDAAAAAGEPAAAVAAAVYAALERDYSALAEEATHSALDPRHAAASAAERHDEIVARLEQERRARDEVEARRARLTEALLFETPGSRVDAFARSGRAAIESKLRGFGFAGDGDSNFRTLLRELAASRATSRASLFLRAMWSYAGQTAYILFAVLCLALAFGLSRLREPATQDALVALYAQLGRLAEWARGHDGALEYASESLVVAGLAAILVNLWRAAGFTGLMFRGLRMLNLDVRERRRELDASAARLERRVAALRIEADAAQGRAEALARRAGGQPATRAPAPAFFTRHDAPERGARGFLEEIGRAMEAGAAPAPQRLILAIDGVDALPADEARRFLEVAVRVAARNVAVVAAADLSRFGAEARALSESLFEIVYEVGAATGDDALAGRLLGGPAAAAPGAAPAPLGGPLEEAEIGYLKTASALVGPRPRALKRFYNAYRLARLADAPRAALALCLAALMAPDPSPAAALRWAVLGEGEALETPAELGPVMAGLGVVEVGKAGARRAYEAARRYAPWG